MSKKRTASDRAFSMSRRWALRGSTFEVAERSLVSKDRGLVVTESLHERLPPERLQRCVPNR
jgi:hypothetical protein